eukprot:c4501_g1_i1.p1 GENE.c4501_g1_i1~~c4501_g1_i1.p1  ORF type:complete len:322 (+),score=44.37 c4501_g1_i1:177-1142(+)
MDYIFQNFLICLSKMAAILTPNLNPVDLEDQTQTQNQTLVPKRSLLSRTRTATATMFRKLTHAAKKLYYRIPPLVWLFLVITFVILALLFYLNRDDAKILPSLAGAVIALAISVRAYYKWYTEDFSEVLNISINTLSNRNGRLLLSFRTLDELKMMTVVINEHARRLIYKACLDVEINADPVLEFSPKDSRLVHMMIVNFISGKFAFGFLYQNVLSILQRAQVQPMPNIDVVTVRYVVALTFERYVQDHTQQHTSKCRAMLVAVDDLQTIIDNEHVEWDFEFPSAAPRKRTLLCIARKYQQNPGSMTEISLSVPCSRPYPL